MLLTPRHPQQELYNTAHSLGVHLQVFQAIKSNVTIFANLNFNFKFLHTGLQLPWQFLAQHSDAKLSRQLNRTYAQCFTGAGFYIDSFFLRRLGKTSLEEKMSTFGHCPNQGGLKDISPKLGLKQQPMARCC